MKLTEISAALTSVCLEPRREPERELLLSDIPDEKYWEYNCRMDIISKEYSEMQSSKKLIFTTITTLEHSL